MSDYSQNKKGFTYVEIMTVVSIIVVITMVTVANIKTSGSASELFVSSQKLISDIRLVQNMSLSATEFEGESPSGGWGLFFDKSLDFFYIFADKANKVENIGEIDHVCYSDCSEESEELFQKISLPEGTKIDRIYKVRTTDGAIIPVDKASVTFEPPDPLVHICEVKDDCDYDKIGIILINKNFDKREVTINFFGLVDTLDVYY